MAFGGSFSSSFGKPVPLAATGSVSPKPCLLLGFICTTTGTLTIRDSADNSGAIIVDSVAVTNGLYLPLNLATTAGAHATLTSAKGTFVVGPDLK